MEYRNRGERCRHGMLIGVILCPGCNQKLMTQRKGYIPSQGGHVVNNHRHGRQARIGEGSEPVVYSSARNR